MADKPTPSRTAGPLFKAALPGRSVRSRTRKTPASRPGKHDRHPVTGEQLAENAGVDRLEEGVVEPGGFASLAIDFLAPTGNGDQHDILAPRLRPDSSSHVVARELRKPDVEQDNL